MSLPQSCSITSCCCFGKFRILNLFIRLPAESHWWEDEIVWRGALFKMNISIKHNNNKDIIFYVKEAPPVPLLPTYPPRAQSNAYHFSEKASRLFQSLRFVLLASLSQKKMFLCWGLRFTNKSLGSSEKQSSQGERSVPPAPVPIAASLPATHPQFSVV